MTGRVPKVGDYVEILKDHSGKVNPGRQGIVTGITPWKVLCILFPDVVEWNGVYTEEFADGWHCPPKDVKVVCRWR